MNNEPKADQLRRTLQTLESEEKKYGHTALPEKRLLRILGLEVDGKEIYQNLALSPVTKIRSDLDGSMMYSSQKAYTLEQQISQQLQRLVNTFISEKAASKITGASLRLGRKVRPSSEQIAAVNNVIENTVSVITGGPGTGKTTMVLGLVRALKGLGLSITLCTPTGKAAKRLGEATGLQKFNPSTVHKHLLNESQGIAKRFDVMIVDEASMLDVGLFHNLISTIPDGARLVLIGDKNQLPPVAAGQPFKDIIETIERYQNYRPVDQGLGSDSGVNGIVAAAYDVLHGRQPNPSFNLEENNFEFVECAKEEIGEEVLRYYFNIFPNLFCKDFSDAQDDIQILSPQRNGLAGIRSLNDAIQLKLTANKSPIFEGKNGVKFYVNDRVIQTSNNYDLGVMNGEIGTVISRNERGITLLIDNKEIVYSNDDMYDLALSYAISIHKSQGSEYPAVIIPISSQHNFMLSRSLIYTAITRGKSKVCLIGEKSTLERCLKNGLKGSRYTGLQIELTEKMLQKKIYLSRLTQVYRQKKVG